jgi:hypothetical protein
MVHGLKSGIIATLNTPNIDSNVAVWKKTLDNELCKRSYATLHTLSLHILENNVDLILLSENLSIQVTNVNFDKNDLILFNNGGCDLQT